MRYAALLRSGRWFDGLPAPMQEALLSAGVLRPLQAGERLFSRGDPPSGIFAVLEGGIRITAVSESGKEALLTLAEPPAWFGEISVFDGEPRTHDAIADVDSLLMHVPAAELDALLGEDPSGWRHLGLLLASKLRLLFIAVEDMALLPLAVRLARWLLMMAEGYGERTDPDQTRRVVEVRQEQLAMMISASRQTVNGVLKELEARGIVRVTYGQVEIVDLEGLREAALIRGSDLRV